MGAGKGGGAIKHSEGSYSMLEDELPLSLDRNEKACDASVGACSHPMTTREPADFVDRRAERMMGP